jgi:two-component system, OmpR family, response regulator VanR
MKNLLEFEIKNITCVDDGLKAFSLYKKLKPDLLITNINLPSLNGIDLIKKIRENDNSIKIIILTQESNIETLLEVSDLKLTKYLIFPTYGENLYEALAKVVHEIQSYSVIEHNILYFKDNYSWNFQEKALYQDLEQIHLTPKEKDLLEYFFQNKGFIISYDQLINNLWDDNDYVSIDSVKTMIKTLRKKLPKNTIHNIYGTGFKLEL